MKPLQTECETNEAEACQKQLEDELYKITVERVLPTGNLLSEKDETQESANAKHKSVPNATK